MIPWIFLDSAPVPGGKGELRLYQRGREHSIMVDGQELMNSRVHSSEDALAELVCARLTGMTAPRMLIGGLGMGYTLGAALSKLGPQAEVLVAELVPAVVEWNRGYLAEFAGYPLQDPRVSVHEVDVALQINAALRDYDAILLDVDNGPAGLSRKSNDRLYNSAGLRAAFNALRPAGVLAVWSAGPDPGFTKRLRQTGFAVDEVRVRARGARGGARHMIWLATRTS
jgi:spermidine synthase